MHIQNKLIVRKHFVSLEKDAFAEESNLQRSNNSFCGPCFSVLEVLGQAKVSKFGHHVLVKQYIVGFQI